jgi:hypothetical protein
MPNGTAIQSSHTCDFLLTDFSPQASKVHVWLGLVQNSLIYVRQLCDSGCEVTFIKKHVEVLKDRNCVMLGSRDPQSRLWRVDLTKKPKSAQQAEFNHVHESNAILTEPIKNSTTAELLRAFRVMQQTLNS